MRLKTTLVLATVFLLQGVGWPQEDVAAEPPADAGSIELPSTLDRVWYRTEKRGGSGGKKLTGDLTITVEELEFLSPKGEVRLPLQSVRAVSLGKIPGDVDTDWVVLAVGPPGATRWVSFRDGAKLGYGQRTERIYRTLREAMRRAGAGPYRVPDGFKAYDALAGQFTLAVPRGWIAYHQTSVEVDGRLMWGRIIFSEHPAGSLAAVSGDSSAALRRIEGGTESAITLDRREVRAGMSCQGLSRSAERKLVGWVEEDPLFALADELLEAPRVEPLPLGDCIGRRIRARVRDATGQEILLDVRAVADDRTLFLFILRSRLAEYEEALARFDRIVASFQPTFAW